MRLLGTAFLFLLAAGVASGLWTASAQFSSPSVPQTFAALQLSRDGALVGTTVQNGVGQDLGRVSKFVVDARSGEIYFAVVSYGGFLGLGRHNKLVPARALSRGTVTRQTVELPMNLARWKKAPDFTEGTLEALGDPLYARRILEYYGPVPSEPAAEFATKR